MQRLIVSLIVVPLFTGCLPGGIDWDTGLNSLSGGGGEGGVTLGEPEPTGGEACVAAVLPAPAEKYSPWRMAASPDGTLYVAGSNLADTAAGMLPGCEEMKGPGGFVVAFAPDGTCSAISQLLGGDYFDIAVQGEQVVAVGRVGDDVASVAYMQVFDAGLAPVVAHPLAGTRADAVAALGDGRWGVVGRGCESGSLYAEYTPGVNKPEYTCVTVGNASEGSSIVVDIPGDTIYLAGRYTDAQTIKEGELTSTNHVWLKSLPLDPALPLKERVAAPAAKQRKILAGTSVGPRLAIAGERLVIADSSQGSLQKFPAGELGDDCKAVVGWLPKQPDLEGQGEAIWLNPEGDHCNLWIHDMVADGEEVLITWMTATSFWISGDPAVHDTGTKKMTSFVGRVTPEAGALSYQANPLKAGDVSRHAVVYPRCDGEAWVAYRTGSGADDGSGKSLYETTERMRFWAPPL